MRILFLALLFASCVLWMDQMWEHEVGRFNVFPIYGMLLALLGLLIIS